MSIRRLTREQVREIDRRATADYGIPGIVLMENAARSAAEVAVQMLDGTSDPHAVIICGGGNNGGDGYAIARHLHNQGIYAAIIDAATQPLKGDAAVNQQIARAMKLEIDLYQNFEDWLGTTDLWIDALFGTGLARPVEGDHARLIEGLNESGIPILAVDVPSGLDCNTGWPLGACVRAKQTVTFVASKAGFDTPQAAEFTGFISIGDIGIPPELVADVLKS